MIRLPARPVFSTQRGLTLIELMIAMLLGLIVVGGVLGIFVANNETHRHTDDLARIQENARVAVEIMGRSMREAGGNPCGIPPGAGLILRTAETHTGAQTTNWWSGGNDFNSVFIGYAGGTDFPANGSVPMVADSDAIITVSANTYVKTVIDDASEVMTLHGIEGLATGDILFACSTDEGRGVVFIAGEVSGSSVSHTPFNGAVENLTTLGRINAEGWFVGKNARKGTSLFRASNGNNGQPEEIAPDVSAMRITYLLPNADDYVGAGDIHSAKWPNVIAAYIELTLSRNTGNQKTINRTVGLTVNLRNRFNFSEGAPNGGDPP